MMKRMFLKIIVLLFYLTACQRSVFGQSLISKGDTCLSILKSYSAYWKKDSLGDNGFRELLGYRVLMNCDCKGEKWETVLEYLGRPGFEYPDKSKTEYRYRLNYYSDDITLPGTLLLDVTVDKNGMITSFMVWEVDG